MNEEVDDGATNLSSLTPRGLERENHKLKASLGYIIRLHLTELEQQMDKLTDDQMGVLCSILLPDPGQGVSCLPSQVCPSVKWGQQYLLCKSQWAGGKLIEPGTQ